MTKRRGFEEGMQLPAGFDLGDPGGLESLRGAGFEGLGSFRGLRGSTFEGLRGSNFEGHVNELRGAMFYVCKVFQINGEQMPHVMKSAPTEVSSHQQMLQTFPCDDLIFGAACSICNW